jgi:hypothetical protein
MGFCPKPRRRIDRAGAALATTFRPASQSCHARLHFIGGTTFALQDRL